jgi:hypothetical protein
MEPYWSGFSFVDTNSGQRPDSKNTRTGWSPGMMLGLESQTKNWASESLVKKIKSDGAQRQKPALTRPPNYVHRRQAQIQEVTSRQRRQEVTRIMKSKLKTGSTKNDFSIATQTKIHTTTEVTALPPSFDWKLKTRSWLTSTLENQK